MQIVFGDLILDFSLFVSFNKDLFFKACVTFDNISDLALHEVIFFSQNREINTQQKFGNV